MGQCLGVREPFPEILKPAIGKWVMKKSDSRDVPTTLEIYSDGRVQHIQSVKMKRVYKGGRISRYLTLDNDNIVLESFGCLGVRFRVVMSLPFVEDGKYAIRSEGNLFFRIGGPVPPLLPSADSTKVAKRKNHIVVAKPIGVNLSKKSESIHIPIGDLRKNVRVCSPAVFSGKKKKKLLLKCGRFQSLLKTRKKKKDVISANIEFGKFDSAERKVEEKLETTTATTTNTNITKTVFTLQQAIDNRPLSLTTKEKSVVNGDNSSTELEDSIQV